MALHWILSLAAAALVLVIGADGRNQAAAAGDPGSELTLMTFNIRYANPGDGPDIWENRRDLLARVIRDADPDIVGLQEAQQPQLDDLAARLPAYARLGVGRDDGKGAGEHCAILYRADRFALAPGEAAEQQGTFWLSDTPEVPGSKTWGNRITRICTWARFVEKAGDADDRLDAGRTFYIYNIHLDHESQPSRERAIELIAARMAARSHPQDPAVLMGDFNAGETNPVVRYARGEAGRAVADHRDPDHAAPAPAAPPPLDLLCTFRAANPDAAEVGSHHAFTGKRTGDLIDYIFVPRGTTVLAADILRTERDGRYPSDHFPVVATVRFAPRTTE